MTRFKYIALFVILLAGCKPDKPATEPPAGPIDWHKTTVYHHGKWSYDYRLESDRTGRTIGHWGYLYYDDVSLDERLKPRMNDWIMTPWGRLFWVSIPQMPSGEHGWMPTPQSSNTTGKELHLPPAETPTTCPVQPINWNTSGEYSHGDWQLHYYCKGQDKTGRQGFRFGMLFYRTYDLGPPCTTHLNDYIETPWGTMYWCGLYRHPFGAQGWQPKPIIGRPIGRRLTPACLLTIQMSSETFHIERERLPGQLDIILKELLGHRINTPHGEFQQAWNGQFLEALLKALQKALTEAPEYAASEENACLARKAAGVHPRHPVLQFKGYWIVFVRDGHPAADGVWSVYIVRVKDRTLLWHVTHGGYRMLPSTIPASLPWVKAAATAVFPYLKPEDRPAAAKLALDPNADQARYNAIWGLAISGYCRQSAEALGVIAADKKYRPADRWNAAMGLINFTADMPDDVKKKIQQKLHDALDDEKETLPDGVIRTLIVWGDADRVYETLGEKLRGHSMEIAVLAGISANDMAVPRLLELHETAPPIRTANMALSRRWHVGAALIYRQNKRGIDIMIECLTIEKPEGADPAEFHKSQNHTFKYLAGILGKDFGYYDANCAQTPQLAEAIPKMVAWWKTHRETWSFEAATSNVMPTIRPESL